ncbi:flagellar biosynthesis protein [Pandoraea thiooxydans]|uniref:Flagellar biosynthesis protein FlhB n=1 Tax=Pandoraea thiooxydans TaxID=445709 RepID=A0A0G3ERY4_9BURK|nr:EscU/YscU/HrcU family type III secretion system export apparatus switch protein [Pandoraea thiooxydans]AKJ69730.1 flagellar biosynthesis protein FlhB [Pandoraea thiooxydans]APR97470.1 flagellar biosynthesis protein [Pandoraea thiooxydans]
MSKHDPRRSAIALSYAGKEKAPRVVAKGYGLLADTIVRTAREHGLYVHESPELVGLLMQVDLDARIPPQLYQAVAELLAWLYRLEAGKTDKPAPPKPKPPPLAPLRRAPGRGQRT